MPRKKTHAEFLDEIRDRPITCLGTYSGAMTKIRFRCDIDGHEWDARPNHILSGRGCPACWIESLRKQNKILDVHGNTVLIDISTPTYPNATSLMDTADFEKIQGRISMGNEGYPVKGFKGSSKAVHLLLNPNWTETDHINRMRHDNRRANLREVTHAQNCMNLSIPKNNTSGTPGVWWDKDKGKWQAYIRALGKQIHLGFFTDKQEAIAVRLAAEEKYFGEYSPNHA